jgi:hypothetical protein
VQNLRLIAKQQVGLTDGQIELLEFAIVRRPQLGREERAHLEYGARFGRFDISTIGR